MSANTRALTPELEEKGLNKVFAREYGRSVKGKVRSSDVFNIETHTIGLTETDLALAAVSEFGPTAEQRNINKDEVLQRGTTLYEHELYTNGITQSYKQVKGDETGTNMVRRVSQLAKAGRETQEKKRFGVLRDNPIVLDGKTLFATDHPLADSSSQSNDISFTTDIYTTIKLMMSALRSQRQFKGDLSIAVDPVMILCTEANYDEVIEVVAAKNAIQSTDDNATNFIRTIFPGLSIGWNPYLGTQYGGNDKDLFMMADKMDHELKVMLREAINTWTKGWEMADNLDREFNAKYMESFGASDYLGLVRGKSAA